MAQAEILGETDASVWLTEETKKKVEQQFLRYKIEFGTNYTTVLNNDDFKKPKWFEGGTVNLGSELLSKQASNDEQTAFVHFEKGVPRMISYSQISSKVLTFTAALASKIYLIPKEARVLIILPNCLEAIVSIVACLRLGVLFSIMEPNYMQCIRLRMDDFKPDIVVTANGCLFDRALVYTVRLAGGNPPPRFRFVVNRKDHLKLNLKSDNNTEELDFYHVAPTPKLLRPYCINKPLYVAYTAGTTGQPKGCVHSARSLYMSCISDNGFTVHSQYWVSVSFFFTDLSNIVGLIGIVLKPLLFKIKSVLYEAVVKNAEPIEIYDVVKNCRATSAYFSKSTLKQLKFKDADGTIAKSYYDSDFQLKRVFTSGSEMNEVLEWTRTLFCRQFPLQVYNFYAITELGGIIVTDHGDAPGRPLSGKTTGRLIPFISAKIIKITREMKLNELCIKLPLPPTMMISYLDNDELFFRNFDDVEGYYATRHLGAIRGLRGNGFAFERTALTFNADEMIPKLEQFLMTVRWVKICCVICKTVNYEKRLYGFFQMKPEYLGEDVAAICKEIQGVVHYVHGSYINFEPIHLTQIPLLADGITPSRELMGVLFQAKTFTTRRNNTES